MKSQPEPLTRIHLEIAVALMEVLEKRLPVKFFRSWKKMPDDPEVFLFGFDEDVPEAPYFRLRIVGGGIGDTYSGGTEYEDVYTLLNMKDTKGNRIFFEYDHLSTEWAGDCSRFTCGYFTEEVLLDLETEFYKLIRAGVQLPDHYLFLIKE